MTQKPISSEQGPDAPSDGSPHTRLWLRDLALWSAIFAGVAALLMLVIDHEPGGVYTRLQNLAAWFGGGPKPEVVTYPMWGLGVVLWLTQSPALTAALQVAASSVAAAALMLRFRREMPANKVPLAVLFILCMPWYYMVILPYANGFAQAFMVLALLAAERAWRLDSLGTAIASGILFGIGQNFRSELVLLPGFCLVMMTVLRRTPRWRSLKIFGAMTAVALLFQLPWALHFYRETGHPKLTESTGWAVMYGALGQLPDNPWQIEAQDAFLDEVVQSEGYTFSGLSEEAGVVFKRRYFEAIKAHPTAVPRVWAHRIKSMFKAPFYSGHIALDEDEKVGLDVVRERFKLKLGIGANQREIKAYRDSGAWDKPASLRQNAAFAYELGSQAALILFFLAVLAGIALTLRAGRVWRGESIVLALTLCPIAFKLLLGVFLTYRHDYLNSISVFCIPFALVAFSRVKALRRNTAVSDHSGFAPQQRPTVTSVNPNVAG